MNEQFCFRIHMDELIEEAEGGIWGHNPHFNECAIKQNEY